MIHADPDNGNAYEGANPPANYSVPLADNVAYVAWFTAQGFPPPEPAPATPPHEITNRQFRLALRRVTGILPSAVTTALTGIADAATREDALSEWEYANTLRRDSSLLLTFASEFHVTAAQLDEIFTLGDTLQ